MTKIKRVLSDDDFELIIKNGAATKNGVNQIEICRLVEQAVLAKLAEQEAETYIILDKNGFEFDLVPSTKVYELKDGETFIPLYAHPIPTAKQEPIAWIFEDELPSNYPYEAMFGYSKVDGVRMFPVYAPKYDGGSHD